MAGAEDAMMAEIVAKVMGKGMPNQPHPLDPNQPELAPGTGDLAYDTLASNKNVEAFGGDGSMAMVSELAQLIGQLPPEAQAALMAEVGGGQAPVKEKGVPDEIMMQLLGDEMAR